MHDLGPQNPKDCPLLPCSITVTQKNTLCISAQRIDAAEVGRLLDIVQKELSRLPARAHDRQVLARIKAMRLFSPQTAERMADCGRIRLKACGGTNDFYPDY